MKGEKLRSGFTTGSCAAAAAKAAAYMLFMGKEKTEITIKTPGGIFYHTPVLNITREKYGVSCAVKKDGGDDPDVTTGYLIYAKVSIKKVSKDALPVTEHCVDEFSKDYKYKKSGKEEKRENEEENEKDVNRKIDEIGEKEERRETYRETGREGLQIEIEGGRGVGRVTKPGLDQPVGYAAINHVPRQMIIKEVKEICDLADYQGKVFVEISVPGGEELAEKTFNPRLGIEGGISILGTTGIVEPMSEKALLGTILTELRQHRALGEKYIAVSPGNYGLEFMKKTFGYDLDKSVKCSNFIGNTIDMAVECGFEKMLITGNIGKLIKVSGGIMNTHSKEGDCRMELMAAASLMEGVETEAVLGILKCYTTEEALLIIKDSGKFHKIMERLMEKIIFYLNKRADGKMEVECIMYSNEFGELAESSGARDLLDMVMEI